MAFSCRFTEAEQEALDYADVFASLGYVTSVAFLPQGAVTLLTQPQLATPYDIAMRLPWHDAPAPWM